MNHWVSKHPYRVSWNFAYIAFTAAYGGLCEASGGRLASLAYTPTPLASLTNAHYPTDRYARPYPLAKNFKNLSKKCTQFLQPKNKKILKKKFVFFFFFPKNFSVENFHMMSTLRMQIFSIIGQGVPEIQGVTHTHTHRRINYFSNIDVLKNWWTKCKAPLFE